MTAATCEHVGRTGHRCGAKVHAADLCTHHLDAALHRDLAAIPRLHDALEESLVGSGSGGGRTSRGVSIGINLDAEAMRARADVRTSLVGWCRLVLEEGPATAPPADTVTAMAAWLDARVTWLTGQAWVDELVRDLAACVAVCRKAEQPDRARRVEIGDCPDRLTDDDGQDAGACDGLLFAIIYPADSLLPAHIRCTSSEQHVWTADQWHALGRRLPAAMLEGGILRDGLADAQAIATMRHLAPRTVRRNLEPVACDLDTRSNLYAIDDTRIEQIRPRAGRRPA